MSQHDGRALAIVPDDPRRASSGGTSAEGGGERGNCLALLSRKKGNDATSILACRGGKEGGREGRKEEAEAEVAVAAAEIKCDRN